MIDEKIKTIIESYKTLLKEIAKANGSNDKGMKDFGAWLKKMKGKRSGYSYKSIRPRITNLEGILNSPNEEVLKNHANALKTYQDKLTEFEEVVNQYLKYKKEASENVFNRSWYVYHFYNKDTVDREPTLARCVLTVNGEENAEFFNVELGSDYIGSYHKSKKNKTVFFDLNTEEDASSAMSGAHIRVYFNDFEHDELLIGSYITYEGDKIVRGAVILHTVSTDSILPPKSISFKRDLKELTNVPLSIRKYLSINRYSQGVSKRHINSIDRLDLHVLNNQFDKWESRFFEEDIPTLFIASPNRSLDETTSKKNSKFVKTLIEKLDTRFNNKGELKRIRIREELEISPEDEDGIMPTSFAGLKTTRFFILIYTRTNIGSLSLVELGYALGNCKSVIVFHEKGAISDRIRAIKKIDGVKVSAFSKLDGRMDRIFQDIVDEIENNLRGYITN